MPIDIPDDPRWAAILARDATADGRFWYSVATTRVYCRPSCPSRHARLANVRLHDTLADARASGARACRRCNPDGLSREAEDALLIERACRMIEAAEAPISLAQLADSVQLSPAYFHRMFRAATGVTPRQFALAARAARARTALEGGASVTAAIHDAGYGSSSRFYDGAANRLGMAPARYRAGGSGETLHFAIGLCSLGSILVAMSATGVAAILLGDDPHALVEDLQRRFPRADLVGGDAAFEAHVAAVIGHVEAPGTALALPLDIRGTAFQQRVWAALIRIPPGRTSSYAEVAAAIGLPAATRAVAAACAANRHAVAIPCHRVVRTDGGLSGYRWGVERKRRLIEREQAG
ncbi:bifunctional DNA-binding transcriptional regulator/O6-methylguanine-DNA methyltransferase Ada [Sphingomonas jatrophae]|uniref:methylated-DNA--[protein]-cysteine S-methyltransferase n=1 Tax=Sphingomonas jatrophae TaxID=1166337 RepID=A0A1I6JZB3_9SPHN|nr:bifunctional DNA-binding transcriptional regulator/O6-methylguanine-DNA methyltransferase Ada [Sphingomonas jatrophae]SFR83870.1 DNA-O6-methylguanine--protein-cysteine S-methyltransferase /Transcriptional regulator Ada [Sphingomonas jatrophae]